MAKLQTPETLGQEVKVKAFVNGPFFTIQMVDKHGEMHSLYLDPTEVFNLKLAATKHLTVEPKNTSLPHGIRREGN